MADRRGASDPGPPGLPGMAGMPAIPGLPGIGALNVGNLLDTVEFVKNAWSSFGVPSALAPTVDVDELDRRIADLKAVEQWLSMNLNLLRTSVQALEIQRGTIATLKAYGEMLGSQAQELPGANALAQAMAAATASAMSTATGTSPISGAASIPAVAPEPSATAAPAASAADAPAPRTPAAEMAAAASGEAVPASSWPSGAAAANPFSGAPGLDPSAWWELLQRQFNQITAAALGAGGAQAQHAADAAGESAAPRAGAREGAPVARGRPTTPGSKTRKRSANGPPESGRRGRRPER